MIFQSKPFTAFELKVKRTDVSKHPSYDFIVIMNSSMMKNKGVKENDYVLISNKKKITLEDGEIDKGMRIREKDGIELAIEAHVISNKNKAKTNNGSLSEGEIEVDQTYREAIGVGPETYVSIQHANKKYSILDKYRKLLGFQKAIVRVQDNIVHYERNIPMVCISEETRASIGVSYGEMVRVESQKKSILMRCTKYDPIMQTLHDDIQKKHTEKTKKAPGSLHYYIDPVNYGLDSKTNPNVGDVIPPIFMDTLSKEQLEVARLQPIKIRKSLSWESQKTLNGFGKIGSIALSVLGAALLSNTINSSIQINSSIPIILFGASLAIVIWSILTSSKFKTSYDSLD